MTKLLFIGALDYPNVPKSGDTVKNRFLVSFFEARVPHVAYIDTMHWRTRPTIIVHVICSLLLARTPNIIVSTSNRTAYNVLRIAHLFGREKNIYLFQIGGTMQRWIRDGQFKSKYFSKVRTIVVETDTIRKEYEDIGLFNVMRVYNIKKFNYRPDMSIPRIGKVRFVFLSRIVELKGIHLALAAIRKLNELGLGDLFVADFYGRIGPEDKERFLTDVGSLNNVRFKGFLDLRDDMNFKILSDYDVMLFPTWAEEGLPGVIIDCAIAGLPVITSDFSNAKELIEDQKNGFIIQSGNVEALKDKMKYVIDHRDEVFKMRMNCIAKAQSFHIDNVLNESLIQRLQFRSND